MDHADHLPHPDDLPPPDVRAIRAAHIREWVEWFLQIDRDALDREWSALDHERWSAKTPGATLDTDPDMQVRADIAAVDLHGLDRDVRGVVEDLLISEFRAQLDEGGHP